ncbi:beta-galactosidase GalA [Bacteroidota bacterium]
MKNSKPIIILLTAYILLFGVQSCSHIDSYTRERIKLNQNWKFALGHATNAEKDFNNGTGYFSYLTKTGFGDGPAATNFDDRAWRILDIPHDWCVELPFAADGGHSHGYRAIGRKYPENSVGWYRKEFEISESDLGKRISIEFDGVHRNSIVWVNGFYLGTEICGSSPFSYDITDYLNYGDKNVVAVRVDATIEEGWYYEGAGIIRNVLLVKTNPLHVSEYGTFVTTDVSNNKAKITTRTTITNDTNSLAKFFIAEIIIDPNGNEVASGINKNLKLEPGKENEFINEFSVKNPMLWSIENPYLYKLITRVIKDNKVVDEYHTTFGIRTIKFDPDKGFFLNGENIKIVGTNLHQDHAGVGRALPYDLQEFRIKKLKEMGNNGVRCSHEPPASEFLDACDKLGMLVIDENRLMGINDYHYSNLERMIKRDRNHPSIVIWSLGNEEWAIEGNIKGERIAATMQEYAKRLDNTRAYTAACSGGWDNGIGRVTEVMGYNYMVQGDIDQHHKLFPWQSGIGSEESNTIGTRGIYISDHKNGHMAPTNRMPENVGTESGWKFYAERPFLSGIFFWTGFDYRGEPNPLGWPAVSSQFGIIDLCGFPKDIFYYLKAWWSNEPVLYLYPHWNWKGKEGEEMPVTVYSNCKEVELFLNGESLGKNEMEENGHLEWTVKYAPGKLEAKGLTQNNEEISYTVETSSKPAALQLHADKTSLDANNEDLSIITIMVNDDKERYHPTANVDVELSIEGPGKIIGVGNGDPSSHEPEVYMDEIQKIFIPGLKELPVDNLENRPETAFGFDDSNWEKAFLPKSDNWQDYIDPLIVVRGNFELKNINENTIVTLFSKSIVENQSVYINGNLIASNITRDAPGQEYVIDLNILKEGKNDYAVVGERFRLQHQWDEPNKDPGVIQVINPVDKWKRKTFNGLAQVIIQSTNEPGEIILKATSSDIKGDEIIIQTLK